MRKGLQRGGKPSQKKRQVKSDPFDFAVLRFDTPPNGRAAMERLLKAYNDGDLPEQRFKNIVYGARAILPWLELERDVKLEAQMDRLEQRVEELLAERGKA